MNSIVTEDADKEQEERKIKEALSRCGYPSWSFKRVKQQMDNKVKKKSTKKEVDTKTKGLVVIPYVEGLAEKANRIFRKHGIATAMRPNTNLRKMLVHPKDKVDPINTTDCIYEIPCSNCDSTYIGETGRKFATRLEEHKKETGKVTKAKPAYTRQARKESLTEQSKSAIADHAVQQNHDINWKEARILTKETNAASRHIRESIEIRKKGNKTMNRDEGPIS